MDTVISPYLNCVQTNLFTPYLCHVNLLSLIMFKTNQPKETMNRKQDREALKEAGSIIKQTFINMENKRIKTNLIKEMKKDNDLKKYVNDMENFTNEQFTVLINIFKKVNLNQ